MAARENNLSTPTILVAVLVLGWFAVGLAYVSAYSIILPSAAFACRVAGALWWRLKRLHFWLFHHHALRPTLLAWSYTL